jgi:DNA polymerase III subunit delta
MVGRANPLPKSEMNPAYLIAGSDAAKIAEARARLRARAEAEGQAGLEVFEPLEGRGSPDADALLRAIPAISLTSSHRYLLADGVERWRAEEQDAVAAALGSLDADTTVVLVAHGKAPAKLVRAVKDCGGDLLSYEAPRGRAMPRHLVSEAAARGFRMEPAAAELLLDRLGTNPLRLAGELDRLALWAGNGGEVAVADIEAMVSDVSETAIWALSDALLDRDPERAVSIAERLIAQGENVTGLIYSLASRLRRAHAALTELEAGRAAKDVEAGLGMHPYAARQLVARLRRASVEDLRAATAAIADLEVWCRGGADYGDELALTLALRRAAGAPA